MALTYRPFLVGAASSREKKSLYSHNCIVAAGSRSHNQNRLNWHILTFLGSNEVSFPIRLDARGQRRRSYETTLKNFVGFAKNSEFVMPDLIRHPEFAEVTGFRPSPE